MNNTEASPSLKNYISSYYGKIAERNGGVNDFFGIVDFRASKKFKLHETHNIEMSADIFNVMNMFNKNRGVNRSLGNQSLYAIGIPATSTTPALPAFDAENRRFNYRVNNSGIPNPSGEPFHVQLGLRYNF